MTRLILLISLLLATQCIGAPNGDLSNTPNPLINIGTAGMYFTDPTAALSFEEVSSKTFSKRFLNINQPFIQFGLITGNIWIKAEITPQPPFSNNLYLSIKAPRMEVVDVYFADKNNSQLLAKMGESRPYLNRSILHPGYIVTLPEISQPNSTIYIKIASHLPINAEINIIDSSRYSQQNLFDFILTGFLTGVIALLLISNLFFFMLTKHSMYAAYGTVLLGILLLHLSFHGFLSQLFPNFVGIQERIYNFSSLLCTTAIILFSRYYLETAQYFPKINRYLIVLSIINALLAIVFTLNPNLLNILVLSVTATLTLLSLTMLALYAYIKQTPYSGYYLLARTSLFLGHGAWILSVYGILPCSFIYQWCLTLTILFEAMIHFTGLISKLISFNKVNAHADTLPQQEIFNLLADISHRLKRQVNIIDGYFSHIRNKPLGSDTNRFIDEATVASNNINHIVRKLDFLDQQETLNEPTKTAVLNQLIESAKEEFHAIDQDNMDIKIQTQDTENIDILKHSKSIQQLIVNLLYECKCVSSQQLNVTISFLDQTRYGYKTLNITCSPTPARSHAELETFNFGLGYVNELLRRLDGTININSDGELHIIFPVSAAVNPMQYKMKADTGCQLLVLGGETVLCKHTLSILQKNWSNNIFQRKTVSDLVLDLKNNVDTSITSILVMFDNEGYIPNLALEQLKQHLSIGDQCLLITKDPNMNKTFVASLGFNYLIYDIDIEHKLKPGIEHLTLKGSRMKKYACSKPKHHTGLPKRFLNQTVSNQTRLNQTNGKS